MEGTSSQASSAMSLDQLQPVITELLCAAGFLSQLMTWGGEGKGKAPEGHASFGLLRACPVGLALPPFYRVILSKLPTLPSFLRASVSPSVT